MTARRDWHQSCAVGSYASEMRLSTLIAAVVLSLSFAGLVFLPDGISGDRNPAVSHALLLVLFFASLAIVAYRLGSAFGRRRRTGPPHR